MTQARRHHFVSECLLAGFTESGSADDVLWVHDLQRRHIRRQRPKEVAHERDWNLVAISGEHPQMVEDAYSDLESRAAPVIRRIEAQHELPSGEQLRDLLGFVAHLVTRGRHHRGWLRYATNRMNKLHLEMVAGTPEQLSETTERLRADAVDVGALDHDRVREIIDSDKYRIEPNQTWLVAHAVVDAERIFSLLRERHWGLLVAHGTDRFICSDKPVTLMPVAPGGSVGWATRNSAAIVPLSKSVVLTGTYEPLTWAPVRTMSQREHVAFTNRMTISNTGFAYSAEKEFVWTNDDGRIANASEWLATAALPVDDGDPDGS